MGRGKRGNGSQQCIAWDGEGGRPGDRVYFEPGEEHWHGATPDRVMAYLAMQEADDSGSPVTWGEPVTDEEYRQQPE